MVVSFPMNFWKYALLTTNVLISLAATALISFGVVALGGAGSPTGAYIISAIGFFVLTLCFVGCFASLRESYFLSIVFVVLVVVAIVGQTVCMIAFAMYKDTLMDMMNDRVENLWQQETAQAGAMNPIQMQYKCCGRDGPEDYLNSEDDVLPSSCCARNNCSNPVNVYKEGCITAAVNFFDDQSDNLMLTCVALIAVEALGLASSYFLAKTLKNRPQKTAENQEVKAIPT